MDDLISQKALLDIVGKIPLSWEYGQAISDVYDIIKTMPTITLDGIRPKGRWKNDGHCSYCGMRNPTCRTDDLADYFPVPDVVFQHLQFCPDCGADMRGGGEDA